MWGVLEGGFKKYKDRKGWKGAEETKGSYVSSCANGYCVLDGHGSTLK